MKYQITDGTVSLGGETVLSHIDFEIQGAQKIAVVGRNGAGKTTLLRLIAGELELERDDRRQGSGREASIIIFHPKKPSWRRSLNETTKSPWKPQSSLPGSRTFLRLPVWQ